MKIVTACLMMMLVEWVRMSGGAASAAFAAPVLSPGAADPSLILEKGDLKIVRQFKGLETIEVTAPMMAGVDTFIINPPGGDNGTVTLTLNGNETADKKADMLEQALIAKKIPYLRVSDAFTFAVDSMQLINKTQERMKITLPPPQKPKATDGGSGRTDPPIGFPPSSFDFSPSTFTDPNNPFVFFKNIELPNQTIPLTLLDFHGRVEFTSTADSNIFDAQFSQFEFDYAPFALPDTSFTAVNREVLDDQATLIGSLDLAAGLLSIPLATNWLDVNGNLAATSLLFFDVALTQVSPTLVDMRFTSTESFSIVPEPASMVLVGIGIAAVGFATRRRIQRPCN